MCFAVEWTCFLEISHDYWFHWFNLSQCLCDPSHMWLCPRPIWLLPPWVIGPPSTLNPIFCPSHSSVQLIFVTFSPQHIRIQMHPILICSAHPVIQSTECCWPTPYSSPSHICYISPACINAHSMPTAFPTFRLIVYWFLEPIL